MRYAQKKRQESTIMGVKVKMQMCAIGLCSLHALWTLATAPALDDWYYGYRILFLLAELKAVWSYCTVELKVLSETLRQLQYSAVATTGNAEVLALCREARALHTTFDDRREHDAFGRQKEIPIINRHQHNQAPVGWAILSLLLLLYNTAHLAFNPVTDSSALLFGIPAIAMYVVLIRFTQIVLLLE